MKNSSTNSPENSETCYVCKHDLSGPFCSNCGHPRTPKRINGKYVISEVGSVLNFDRGILFTIRELLIHPGKSIRCFIHHDRNRLMKPIVFVILCSLLYTVLQRIVQFEDGYVNYSQSDMQSATAAIFTWVSENYGYANILMALIISAWVRLFFLKHQYNFFEILILLCYVMGIGMLLFSFFGVFHHLTNLPFSDQGYILGIIYTFWAIGQFFAPKKISSYIKATLAYLIGLVSFTLIVFIIGAIVDVLFMIKA